MTRLENHIHAKINLREIRHKNKFMTNTDEEIKEYNKRRRVRLEIQAIKLIKSL